MSFQAKTVNPANGALTVLLHSRPYTVDKSHENYIHLLNAFHNNDAEEWLNNIDVKKAVENYAKSGGLEVKDNEILYKGEVLHSTLCQTILDLKRNGHPIDYMVLFLENVLKNPSMQTRRQIYDFLKHRNMPITPDGCFVAYKAVDSKFWSKRGGNLKLLQGKVDASGRIFNGVGEVIECERCDVDDDRNNQCSYGLHVGALSYSGPNGNYWSHGDKTILVKVNPADVIAVPEDYDATKMRVCKYEVVGEYEHALEETVYGQEDLSEDKHYKNVDDVLSSYDYDEYDDEDKFPGLWADLQEGDEVVLLDKTGRVDHTINTVVLGVYPGDCITFGHPNNAFDVIFDEMDEEFEIVRMYKDI